MSRYPRQGDNAIGADVAILDHYVTVDNDHPEKQTAAFRQLLDRVAPTGSSKLGTVFIPPSYMDDPIELTRDGSNAWCIAVPSNVSILGSGRGSAFVMPGSLTQTVRAFNVQGKSHVRISGIAVDGNRASSTADVEHNHCIFVYDSDDVTITDCYLHGATGDGISISGSSSCSSNVTIDACTINDNRRNGVTVEQVNHVKITRNAIDTPSDATGSAIDFEPFSDVALTDAYIAGNTLSQQATDGYIVTLAGRSSSYPFRGIRFVDNDLRNGIVNVIRAEGVIVARNTGSIMKVLTNAYSKDVSIAGNVWSCADTRQAFDIVASLGEVPTGYIITENVLTLTGGGSGIRVRGADAVIVRGNVITGASASNQHGIEVTATRSMRNVQIQSNLIRLVDKALYASPSSNNRLDGLQVVGNLIDGSTNATAALDFYSASNWIDGCGIANNLTRNITGAVRSIHASTEIQA